MRLGAFTIVLHSHLPYVLAHGRWPHGTEWLSEAAAESYLPLIRGIERLLDRGLRLGITLGITPILAEQLASDAFKEELDGWLEERIESARHDAEVFDWEGHQHRASLARRWEQVFTERLHDFRERYGRDIIGALRRLQDVGAIEIITSAATHGYLPLIGTDESVRAQIRVGVESYRRHFGRSPRGIWLPECAYRPRYDWAPPVAGPRVPAPGLRRGIEEFLADEGIEYFFVDTHLLRGGQAMGTYAQLHPALRRLAERYQREYGEAVRPEDVTRTANAMYRVHSAAPLPGAVHVFAREPTASLQVWSGEWGYPGDGWYLEFHKRHHPGGHRYWRVTSRGAHLGAKAEYVPEMAAERVEENALHFHGLVRRRLEQHREVFDEPGIVVAPFDTELFGHWWHEGVEWILRIMEKMARDDDLELTTGGGYLDNHDPAGAIALPEGSWGEGGHHYIWLNHETDWTWPEIYRAELTLAELVDRWLDREHDIIHRLLRLAARELLLLQSSDWQFLISTQAARDYAQVRFGNHMHVFDRAVDLIRRQERGEDLRESDWKFVGDAEARDGMIFPELDLALWRAGAANP
ncbi:MAG TPA: 1,4-alpha-glucan branching protein domain-containing protein [Longimicrobiales bacterium]